MQAKQRGFKFPYLYDGDSRKTAAAYGVIATPQVFLFDSDRKLRYVGRIDDSDMREVKSHDARHAIEALLADKPVPVEKSAPSVVRPSGLTSRPTPKTRARRAPAVPDQCYPDFVPKLSPRNIDSDDLRKTESRKSMTRRHLLNYAWQDSDLRPTV